MSNRRYVGQVSFVVLVISKGCMLFFPELNEVSQSKRKYTNDMSVTGIYSTGCAESYRKYKTEKFVKV
jgi:hypothetical protein